MAKWRGTVSWPAPTRKAHHDFCVCEEWKRVRDAQGRTGTHHLTFELDLPDGSILRTRISHPPDRSTYGASVWSHILRDQLRVSVSDFWACAKDGIKPPRDIPEVPKEALPAELVFTLVKRIGLPEHEVAEMTKEQAIERVNQFWTQGD
jgi:hypothetical protein